MHKESLKITSITSAPVASSCKAELIYILAEEQINTILEDICGTGVDNRYWQFIPGMAHSLGETVLTHPCFTTLFTQLQIIASESFHI